MGGLKRRRCGPPLARALLAAWVLGCASDPPPRPPPAPEPPPGAYHVVRPGETVWRLSRRYGVPVEAIVRANGIRDVRAVPTGARLWIPGAAGGPDSPPRLARVPPPASACDAHHEAGLVFAWPVQGKLTSRYGRRGRRRHHDGIDIAAHPRTLVRAAEAGRVIHSGRGLGAYGNVVIVRHPGRWATVYAHNHRNLVRKGASVQKGQVIAEVGRTGNATGPHLHFEVRRGDEPRDPLLCLPRTARG